MNWNEKCLMELTHHNLFEDNAHRLRFRDLLSCYFTAPFFTKGPVQMYVPFFLG